MEPGWAAVALIIVFMGIFAFLNIIEKGSID